MSRSPAPRSLARLEALDDDKNVTVVIETPKGGHTKLAFDEKRDWFVVKKVLPEGMSFPFDFGFIPSTLGDDGDPLDILVLMDEPVPMGTIVPTRLLGVIEGKQTEVDGESAENDRLIGAACASQLFEEVTKLSDLPSNVVKEIERFFVTYNEEEGKRFEPKGCHGRRRASALLETGIRRYRRKRAPTAKR